MPVYTYRREDGTTFDIRQTFLDDSLETCPTTGQAVNRVIQPTGIIFKGSGFYVNDHNKAHNSASPSNKNGESGPASDSAKAEAKSKTQSDSQSETKAASPITK